MTIRPRPPKPRINVAALEYRHHWHGLLPGVEPLTDAEQAQWRAYRESQASWVPRRGLNYCWSRADPFHGDGGLYAGDGEEPWRIERFRELLDRDRADIGRVLVEHPHHAPRLAQWAIEMEALGTERETHPPTADSDVEARFYLRLQQLGYDGREDQGWDDD